MIAVDSLSKSFGKRREVKAVDGVSFTAADGEITGLLGPNGAGKTTLLRMLATLVVPDAGRCPVVLRGTGHLTIGASSKVWYGAGDGTVHSRPSG